MGAILHHPEIEVCDYQNLKNGKDFNLQNGDIISNESLTSAPTKPKSYAFCSDTKYLESIIPIIKDVDLLYHEATFLNDKIDLAKITGHSTAAQAATIAKKANVGQLIIGHYSNRYTSKEEFKAEAETVFSNTHLAIEGKVIETD
jgi:ribonuclease Z